MLRTELADLILNAARKLVAAGALPPAVIQDPEITDTKSADHGDYACNLALVTSKAAGLPPRKIAEAIAAELVLDSKLVKAVDVAGPGFINIRVQPPAISRYVAEILAQGDNFGRSNFGGGEKVNVEFVSVNPNGPITIGSGRGAAFGDALCRVLDAAGFKPFREYYINDGVNSQQMKMFAESVKHYYREAEGRTSTMPENGYKGAYVSTVADRVRELYGAGKSDEPIAWFQQVSQDLMIDRQKQDLQDFRVKFDQWTSEQTLHDSGKVQKALDLLVERGTAYRASQSSAVAGEDAFEEEIVPVEGEALWLRSTSFGDDKDRVLVRADGRPAYIAADVAYLEDKFSRGFKKLKLILGPDHHGYVGRLYAACQASGHTTGKGGDFEIVIYQVVRFVKEGAPAKMRKRDGNIYELRDLIEELGTDAAPNAEATEKLRIGADLARFFFLMRSQDTHMDFDIDLATKQSDENPVFYAQYAHARICSVIAKGDEAGLKPDPDFDLALLSHPKELELIKKILDLPFDVQRTAGDYGVHRLTTFAVELGRTYHHFYDACKVVQKDQPDLSQARLALCAASRQALANTFDILGVSAPERMDRQRETVA